ncbi:MAG: acyltransferase, partial [Bacteroidaceae bacterium]|nr:acyltransferase [Bacteroidaceae bacterium]
LSPHAFDALAEGSVAFFFVLSGVVITHSYGKRLDEGTFSMRRFLLRRLRKLYPLHVLCLLASLFVYRQEAWKPLVANLLLVQSWVPLPGYYFSGNSVSWFLSSLLFCYALFPLLYRALVASGEWTFRLCMCVILVAYGAYLCRVTDVNTFIYVAPYSRVVDFAVGMGFARYHRSLPPAGWVMMRRVMAVVLMAVTMVCYPLVSPAVRACSLFWVPSLAMIVTFAETPRGEQPGVLRRALRACGRLSFAFFMVHQLVIHALCRVYSSCVGDAMPLGWQLVAATVLSLLIAAVIHSVLNPQSSNLKTPLNE